MISILSKFLLPRVLNFTFLVELLVVLLFDIQRTLFYAPVILIFSNTGLISSLLLFIKENVSSYNIVI